MREHGRRIPQCLLYRCDSADPGETLEGALKALDAMTEKNWRKQRELASAQVRQAKGWIDGHLPREAGAGEEVEHERSNKRSVEGVRGGY